MEQVVAYKTLIDLGFKRFEGNDQVWFNKYGYDWFWLELKLTKRIHVFWCPEEKKIILRRTNKNEDILAEHTIRSMKELKCCIEFFKSKA